MGNSLESAPTREIAPAPRPPAASGAALTMGEILAASVVILAIATFVRSLLLLPIYLEPDEIVTAWIVFAPTLRDGIGRLLNDSHPPLYPILATLWTGPLGADGLWGLRLLSLAASLLTLPLLYQLGRRLASPAVGLVAMALLAVSPFHIALSPLARGYALMMLLAVLSLLLIVRGEEGRGWPALAPVVVVNIVLVYVHYYGVFFVAAEAVYVVAVGWRKRGAWPSLGRALAVAVPPVLALLPWLAYALPKQAPIAAEVWENFQHRPNPLQAAANAAMAYSVGLALDLRPAALGTALLAALLLAALALARPGRRLTLLVVCVGLTYIVLAALVVLRYPFYSARYFAPALPIFLLAVAGLVVALRWPWRIVLLAALALAAVYGQQRLVWAYENVTPVPPERRAVYDFLRAHAGATDDIVFTAPWQWSELRAFYPDLARRAHPLPGGDTVKADVARPTWLVGFRDEIETWRPLLAAYSGAVSLDATGEIEGGGGNPTLLYHFTPPPANPAWQPSAATFNDGLALNGVSLPTTPLAPGDGLPVGLRWRAASAPRRDYTLFLHLLDEGGQYVTGYDAAPTPPTGKWPAASETVMWRSLYLPPELASGRYTVEIGWYPSGTDGAARLRAADGADSVRIGEVTVAAPPTPPPPWQPPAGQDIPPDENWNNSWLFDNRLPLW
ncbi:MAG: glycosyltransferase family 39 protein [Anaerolineae bacterium]